MPKNLANLLASKKQADATDTATDALMTLVLELFHTLVTKNVLTDEDVAQIFSRAVELSPSQEEELLRQTYNRLMLLYSDDDTAQSD
jgi:hypothetical protein